MWFDYLSNGFERASAFAERVITTRTNQHALAPSAANLRELEEVWTHYLRLALYHAQQSVVAPAVARVLVLRALDRFPSNPEFLSVLILGEARLGKFSW